MLQPLPGDPLLRVMGGNAFLSVHRDGANRIKGTQETQQTTGAKADLRSRPFHWHPGNIIYRYITSERRGRPTASLLGLLLGAVRRKEVTIRSAQCEEWVTFASEVPPSTFGEVEEQNAAAAVEPAEPCLNPPSRPPKKGRSERRAIFRPQVKTMLLSLLASLSLVMGDGNA